MGTSVPWLKCLEFFGGRNSWPGFEHVNQHSLALEDITEEYKGNIQMDLFAHLRKCTRDPFLSHIFCCPHREVCCCHADATSVVEQLSVL